jgi:endonuclease YncB( thermonuclease family)
MIRAGRWLLPATLLLPFPAVAMPLPDCAGSIEIAHAKVVRVEKDGALVLSDGRAVLLEGIRLPGADRPEDPIAAKAHEALRGLVMSAPLTLTSTVPKQDRYGRMRVQAFADGWLQVELLKRGLARVSPMPDRQECVPDFYDAEIEARKSGQGLWALPQFAVRKAENFSAPEGSFQIVEGHVFNVGGPTSGRAFLDFNADFRKGLSAIIAPEDRKAFRNTDLMLEDLAGHDVRIRGTVINFNGRPEIALFNPRQIELLGR